MTREEIESAVNSLRGGYLGLVVLINKYDGVDLPDDACRVLLIDGLPEVYEATARREKLSWFHIRASREELRQRS